MTTISNNNKSDFFDGRVPIVLGVTGHRDISPNAIKRIKQQLNDAFYELKQYYPNTPLVLITPLAEGADRLVADIALEHDVELCVALPMSSDEYQKDFSSPESRKRFTDLLQASKGCHVITGFDPEQQRDLCYANVGRWLVDHSDILIALWDGQMNELSGGTGEVVQYALNGVMPSLKPYSVSNLALQKIKPVLHIPCPRQGVELDLQQESTLYENFDELQNTSKVTFKHYLEQSNNFISIENFNLRASKLVAPGYPLIDQGDQKLPLHLRFIHQMYLKADTVANQYQKVFRRYTALFYSLSAILMLTLVFYFKMFPFTYVIGFYLFIYVITLLVSIQLKNSDYQKRYHLYRLLGETSRLFFFFHVSELETGKRNSILDNARESQYFVRKLGSENEWVIAALKKSQLFFSGNNSDVKKSTTDSSETQLDEELEYEARSIVINNWINDQQNYFTRAAQRDMTKMKRLNFFGSLLFLLSFLAGITLFSLKNFEFLSALNLTPILSVLVGASVGLGGIIKTYVFTMGYSELAGQYKLMQGLYTQAAENISDRPENYIAIFEQLWWEAFMENIEWFSLKNARLVNTVNVKKFITELIRFAKI